MKIEQKICEAKYLNNPYLEQEKPKSKGIIGNITIYFTKTFNCLQRFMWKKCFGLEINNMEANNEKMD